MNKWIVKIPAKQFMSGIHRFRTKKLAEEFVRKWKATPGNQQSTYAELPFVYEDKGS